MLKTVLHEAASLAAIGLFVWAVIVWAAVKTGGV